MRLRSWLPFGVGALAMTASALAVCVEPKPWNCATGAGFCAASLTACENGWHDAAGNGWTVSSWFSRPNNCWTFAGCTSHPCSTTPGGFRTGCQDNGSCCTCSTRTTATANGTSSYYPTAMVVCEAAVD
jgi:hypothetical protein